MRQRIATYPSAATRADSSPYSNSGGLYALQFPSNPSAKDNSAPYAVLEFANPHLDGLPLWGPGGQGWTLLTRWRTKSTI